MGKTELLITIILFNLFFVLFVVAIMVYIKKYKERKREYLNEIKIANEIHQKELLSTQLEIQQATMQQIGRELHDNIGQKLTLVSLYTQQLVHENKVPQASNRIEQIYQIINSSLQDLRSLSKNLTNDNISENEIVTLIQEEVDHINALKKCKVSFEHDFERIDLEFVKKNVLLRITQEFLQNSLKHAQCSNISIQLKSAADTFLMLKIQDDGMGFDLDNLTSDGIGLKNMKKRAEIIGGEFNLTSKPNLGTALNIILNGPA
ncbi:two-component sensor histidine kinase [Pedobacter sp. HDW13]|uniref:sensor histidine kinase n=1 Tax=unclassified Pedobacter TaxID=2628915 RepID=UPI000F5B5C19|nr:MULTISPECIES: ATP-binding protein [unclassified Pedobacter]QIL40914.1 two-component sensor histidine kinase [Pedobacter sp. HDW13]RQO71273.1 two-component sensor histidine kinase [Pedobacter sp. KBW01]